MSMPSNGETQISGGDLPDFHSLSPNLVINLVEKALAKKLTNFCLSLTSYINRVYELRSEDGDGIVVKFYRPGRWSREALQDEHDFLAELTEHELPVVAPLSFANGATLEEFQGMYFTLFPKRAGRPLDEPNDEEWMQLGRLLARVHNVGAGANPRDRITMAPEASTRANCDLILQGNFIPPDLCDEYRAVTDTLLALITPMFEDKERIRIHGDCHQGNIVNRLDGQFYLIDFDDMALGPAVQDFWMLLPGHARDCLMPISMFLEGYETFRTFNRSMLDLIEPLRAMRYIHYCAWCAVQVADGGFARVAPDWGSEHYWRREIKDLRMQIDEIKAGEGFFWAV